MNCIVDKAQQAAIVTAHVIAAVAITAVAPLVSAIAIPIFAIKACIHWNEHRSLYNLTLTNLTREKFGRIPGQDYTRWDGKAINQVNTNPTCAEKMHETMSPYIHGAQNRLFRYKNKKVVTDTFFKTPEDLNWLNREFERKQVEELLNTDLKMLRAFSKALIPIVGVLWVVYTEALSLGGASQLICGVCAMGGSGEDTHWGWNDAINFHRKTLAEVTFCRFN